MHLARRPAQFAVARCICRKERIAADSLQAEALLSIDQGDITQLPLRQDQRARLHLHMRFQPTLHLQLAQSQQTQPAGEIAGSQGRDIGADQA